MATKEKFSRVGAALRPESLVPAPGGRKPGRARSKLAARGPQKAPATAAQRRFLAATWLGIAFMLLYAVTIGGALLAPDYTRADRIASGFLLFGLVFIMVHGLGYANSMLKANWHYRAAKTPIFASSNAPRVACLISSFNEPPEVLEETVAAVLAMDYAFKEIVILDDSTKAESREAAQNIAARYGVGCVQRSNRRGFKAGAINEFLPQITADYVALFDADALPTAAFLRECVPQIESNPKLGFLQTPQFYANAQVSYTALASSRQQNVFYEYICEGKSTSRAAFCCGTNVIFRRAALQDVGGFNEASVTEDFATSFQMHARGWDSLYLNRVYVYSLAPENLAAYFTQQSRWSFGTLSTARQFIKQFLSKPRSLSAGQWWEYFLSATYYLVGWVNFIFILLPISFLFFDIKPLRQDVSTYLLVFVPYLLFSLNMFYSGMEARGYKLGETVLGQQIGFLSFPTHMKSAVSALLGQKRPFGVTPKGVGGRISWLALWPQIGLLLLSLGAFCFGIYRVAMGLESDVTAIGLNSLWALYHVWMLGGIFRLNRPVREGAQKWFFDDVGDGQSARIGASAPADLEGVRNPVTLGRVGAVVAATVLAIVGTGAFAIAKWSAAPGVPVNVTIVDRTLGPQNRDHRGLVWTLNYLKIRKQPTFGPSGGARTNYDAGLDYFGTVPDPKGVAKRELGGQGAPVIYGFDRPIPARLSNPGAIFLVDTYGEYRGFDPKSRQTVSFRGARRGLSSVEIDAIDLFARRGGLVMAQWNTLGYPTKPGNFVAPAQLEAAIEVQRQRLARLNRFGVPGARERLRLLQNGGTFKAIGIARGQLEDARGAVIDATFKLRGLQASTISNTVNARQGAAAARLEALLRVRALGWYGRYVENFARQKQSDYSLWKSVRDDLTQRNGGRETLPSGPGFVFYPDAPKRVFDVQTGTLRPAAFSKPIALLGADLEAKLSGDIALIRRNPDPRIAVDPLLSGVSASVPDRNWFEVVAPASNALVLANHHLKIAPAAAARLRQAGFPARYIAKGGRELVFPAAIIGRDASESGAGTGGAMGGALRSLYFAGDLAGAPVVSELAQKLPALGALEGALAPRFGDLTARTYWEFFEPLLGNALKNTPRIRSSAR